MKKISTILVDALLAAGVQRIYGVAGDSLNALTEEVRGRKEITWTHVRNEEVGAFAAGAEAYLTKDLTVCAGSCGPGNLHLINGLFDCHRSRVPVLAIAAQIPSPEIGSDYFQETHPERLFRDCSHYCETVTSPEQFPRILEIAMRTALTKRGVAVIVLPGDIAFLKAPERRVPFRLNFQLPLVRPTEVELDKAAQLLNDAKKITILGGAGCAGAHGELLETAERLKAPIVHALRGKEYIEHDNPYDVGMTGLLGFSSGYRAIEKSDLLLMLGTDFPYQQFYPTKAKVIQVDLRGEQLGRRTAIDLGLIGDVQDTLRALLPRLEAKADSNHLEDSRAHYKKAREDLDELATGKPGDQPIHPQYLARLIDELSTSDAVFTCDVGTPTVWAARYLTMNGRRRLLGSFTHGSMASAMAQGIGAQAAFPGRQVVALCGDGGLAMLMGDMLSLKQLNLPVKIVVFNNNSLGFVELEMKAAGLLPYATNLENPDFGKMAEGCGMLGLTVKDPGELRPALHHAFSHPGPALVNVIVNRQELSMPPSIDLKQMMGFSTYMGKAILSGRGDEIIDLAKSNLLR